MGFSLAVAGGVSCCSRVRVSIVVEGGLDSCGSLDLQHRLNSCGTQAQQLCGMWDLPRSGIEPRTPELAGGFFITKPPGKP